MLKDLENLKAKCAGGDPHFEETSTQQCRGASFREK